jgi:hypothetical protein
MQLHTLTDRVMTEGICRLLNVVVGDLIDEDRFLRNRPHFVSGR